MIAQPFQLGQMDAEDELPCVPELYFCRRDQCIAYAGGYAQVKPDDRAAHYWQLLYQLRLPLREHQS